MIIYKATNKINDKVYVGQTISKLNIRINRHRNTAKKSDSLFSRAIRKYELKNFIWEVLCECQTIEELNEKEIYYIELYKSFGENGYNMNSGGDNYIRKPFTEEHKAKIGASKIGKKREYFKRDMDISGEKNPNYGKKHPGRTLTEEQINKIKISKINIQRNELGQFTKNN